MPSTRITYVARSFLDYRVPVLAELDALCGKQLRFISSTKWTPQRVLDRLQEVLGERAIYLSGEKSTGVDMPVESNSSVCIPYQPGLLKTIARTCPDVVVGDGFFQWTFAALLCRFYERTPLVVCYERWSHTERSAQWYRRAYRALAIRFVGAICCNGCLSEQYVRSLGVSPNRITTGHMAADIEHLAALRKAVSSFEIESLRKSWCASETVFLYVGRLIRIKGLRELLNAWAKFEERGSGTSTLVLVGSGPEEAGLRSQAKRQKLRRVIFAGTVDYERLAPYYAAADAFIIPTLEDNWSLVVPEAMACGLPILCSKFNGCWPELVKEGENGWVFDPWDSQGTIRAMEQAAQDHDRLRRMGYQSRKMVSAHSPARAAQAIFNACNIALSSQRTTASEGSLHPQF
jgi:glycosyltransferase involved in cell wall biosynthesis